MNKTIAMIVGALAMVATVGSAQGADASLDARPMSSSWSGAYVGLSVGARSAKNRWRTSSIAPNFGAAFVPTEGTDGAMDSTAAAIGGYLGNNWLFASSWVAGIEGEFGWGDNSKKASTLPGTAGLFFGTPLIGLPGGFVKDTWNGSLRGRLGYLLSPSTLVYGTGGVALQRVELGANCKVVSGNSFCFGNSHNETHSSTRIGWTLGGGVEHKIEGNWGLRLDYRYADFGTWNQDFFVAGGVGVGFDDRLTAHVTTRTHTATIGLAYQF